jgi:hypothetical protein
MCVKLFTPLSCKERKKKSRVRRKAREKKEINQQTDAHTVCVFLFYSETLSYLQCGPSLV